jgi:succinate dehydrogenase / fumarate reductase membrane anchor subunit
MSVRNLGSAKEGAEHWWMQRVTAIALVPLVIWFVASLLGLIGAPREAVASWLGQPVVAVLMLGLLFALFTHSRLGLQVIIEDYVHNGSAKLVLVLLNTYGNFLLGVACAFAVLRLAFEGL